MTVRRSGPMVLAAVLVLLLPACTAGQAATTTTTTTTTAPSGASPAAEPTTTTLGPGAVTSRGFRTREPNVLVVATERLTAPWYTGPSTDLVTGGFDYAVAHEIGSRLGVPIVHVVKSSLVLMMTGQDCGCDIMLGGITITDGRARTLDLTEPYTAADQAVLARKGTLLTSAAEAGLLRWAVELRNPVGISVLADRVKPATAPTMLVNEQDGVRLLERGSVDALLLDLPEALAIAATDPALSVAGQFRTGGQYAVALNLGSPNTAIVNDVIREMRDDGILTALFRAHLGAAPEDIPVVPP